MTVDKSVPRYFCYLIVAVIVIVLDQVTKLIAYDRLLGQQPVDVLPVLQWALVFNRGAAFGFLNEAGGMQHYFFSGLAILVSACIMVWLWRIFMHNTILAWGLTLVLAGALGNLVDRLRFQYVIDFINLHYHDWYFPAFNIADISITFGAIFLIIDILGITGGASE
jgi:signal peptidase II